MRANALPRALLKLVAMSAVALVGFVVSAPAQDLSVAYVTPAELTPELAASRLSPPPMKLRGSFSAQQPELTNDLLAAYVKRGHERPAYKRALDAQLGDFTAEPQMQGA